MEVFVSMPFDASAQKVADFVASDLEQAGFAVSTESAGAKPLERRIFDEIGRTDIFIADVSGSNPNVMYELGIASAMGKRIILLVSADKAEKLPFDIASYRVLTYDPTNITALRKRLMRHIEDLQPYTAVK
jgi:nucleoside 2-deoxyribosyltransferase